MGTVPVDFVDKWKVFFGNFHSINFYSLLIALGTVLIISLWPKLTRRIPGSLVAIILATVSVHFFHLPVETIGSKFGTIPSGFPKPVIPGIDFATIKILIQPAFTIAILCGIESLLSAVVADGMIGGNHKSNMELVAQGVGNIFSSIFGGIPATGAIARTATNIKSGGRTPVAGIVHSITLLLIMLFVGKWAAMIPMAALAGILVVVAYNMSEWKNFIGVLKGPKSDMAVLITTFLLTVLVDLTVAIEIGMVLAVFLFMRNMIKFSDVTILTNELEDDDGDTYDEDSLRGFEIPVDVEVFEISGPLFFGAAYKFKDAIRLIEKAPKVLILRMRKVPIIDATGIKTLEEVVKESKHRGTTITISEIQSTQVAQALKDASLDKLIGLVNITDTFAKTLERSREILKERKK
jgi:sulfate permease, SulP family